MSPTMLVNRFSKSAQPDSLKSRASLDLDAASRIFPRKSSELISVRPMPSTSNSGFMQPAHDRLYKLGISFRLVRSPDAPKITRIQESPVGNGSWLSFSRGLASTMVDIHVLPISQRSYLDAAASMMESKLGQ